MFSGETRSCLQGDQEDTNTDQPPRGPLDRAVGTEGADLKDVDRRSRIPLALSTGWSAYAALADPLSGVQGLTSSLPLVG
ncbi:hypothetical protein U1Q18_013330 [Sarracenia purpurea var. burkii]